MYKKLILASLFVAAANVSAYQDIDVQNVNKDNVAACIEARLKNEAREDILASMRNELEELYQNNKISYETYEECVETVNNYRV